MDHNLKGTIEHYNIFETIGHGATCKVKLAIDTSKNPGEADYYVAVKILRDNLDA